MSAPLIHQPLFPMGELIATPGGMEVINRDPPAFAAALLAHLHGDWGEMDAEDKATNNRALKEGQRLMSAYTIAETHIWIITEWDRSVTTILLPEEY